MELCLHSILVYLSELMLGNWHLAFKRMQCISICDMRVRAMNT